MAEILDFLKSLYNAERLLEIVRTMLSSPAGILALCGITFSETGLLLGFFLPGDTLLFSIGVASGAAALNIYLVAGLLIASAIIGDNVGYYLGRKSGPRIFSRPKSRFFHPDHLQRTEAFYKSHGARAVVYARFIPIIRTCTPFIAGVARMDYGKYLLFSVVGGIFWIASLTTLGYQLGQVEFVRHHFEKVVIAVVLISVIPLAVEARKAAKD